MEALNGLCWHTHKLKLSGAAAAAQVHRSRRSFEANRCRVCGWWHVNSPGFINRQMARRAAQFREQRKAPDEVWGDQG
jgi:hypothetical protein